ncbi:uncharacterized protein LY79DRAFT_184960 [Colletotrichum navitas]|uniref:Uncharacterized protein n=1 Tax=Colletotrichum navitas TaxID=681940 RepID=A0AAD8V6H7_9PEZI|nr:uncharacterized protein LY79DRAFT_184960 [Colletotrichum navitas]KAK1593345.1 hypothetical protein LY79DRAFT_184960 [Colletotrichum navitas]
MEETWTGLGLRARCSRHRGSAPYNPLQSEALFQDPSEQMGKPSRQASPPPSLSRKTGALEEWTGRGRILSTANARGKMDPTSCRSRHSVTEDKRRRARRRVEGKLQKMSKEREGDTPSTISQGQSHCQAQCQHQLASQPAAEELVTVVYPGHILDTYAQYVLGYLFSR